MARLGYCQQCQTCLISHSNLRLCGRCQEREMVPRAERLSDLCLKCKCIRPILDFPLRYGLRQYTCSKCHTRRRDQYNQERGRPVSEAGRTRQLARARRVIELALQARLQKERQRRAWEEGRAQWQLGQQGFTIGQIESFRREQFYQGIYCQWQGVG